MATIGSLSASTNITVKITDEQNGVPPTDAGSGKGGWGGVGGEGPGLPVDPAIVAILEGPATSDPSLTWLYPYDKTVWPLGAALSRSRACRSI